MNTTHTNVTCKNMKIHVPVHYTDNNNKTTLYHPETSQKTGHDKSHSPTSWASEI
jgi:hypothetical protein